MAQEDRLDFKRVLPIFVIVLVDLMGLTIIIPSLTHYGASFGANPFLIGALGAAYPLMQLVGGPVLGALSDRFGRKPVLVVSQFGTFAGFLLLGFANSLLVLFIARIIDGISGGNIVAAQAAITDSTTERTRTQGLGLVGAAFGLGFTLGPAIGGAALALTDNNYAAPAFIAAAFSLLSLILTVVWFEETLPAEDRGPARSMNPLRNFVNIRRTTTSPLIVSLLVLMFAQQMVFGGFQQLVSLFNLSQIGLSALGNAGVFLMIGVIAVVVQGGLVGRWSRKYGDFRIIYGGMLALAVGLTLMAFTPRQGFPGYDRAALLANLNDSAEASAIAVEIDLPEEGNVGWAGLVWLLVTMVPCAVGGTVLRPSINSLLTREVSAQDAGTILGVSMALVSAANAASPIIGGALFQALGAPAPYLTGGLLMAALLVFALRRVTPRIAEQPVPA